MTLAACASAEKKGEAGTCCARLEGGHAGGQHVPLCLAAAADTAAATLVVVVGTVLAQTDPWAAWDEGEAQQPSCA